MYIYLTKNPTSLKTQHAQATSYPTQKELTLFYITKDARSTPTDPLTYTNIHGRLTDT